jgi:hypothetical protein
MLAAPRFLNAIYTLFTVANIVHGGRRASNSGESETFPDIQTPYYHYYILSNRVVLTASYRLTGTQRI